MYYDPVAYARKARDRQQEWADISTAYRKAANYAEQDGYPHTAVEYVKYANAAEINAMHWGLAAVDAEGYAQQIGP